MKNKKEKVWNKYCGTALKVLDFSGREIHKDDYAKNKSDYGWNCGHLKPKSKKGTNGLYNLIPTNIKTNEEMGDKDEFQANGKQYIIKPDTNDDSSYRIYEIKDGAEIVVPFITHLEDKQKQENTNNNKNNVSSSKNQIIIFINNAANSLVYQSIKHLFSDCCRRFIHKNGTKSEKDPNKDQKDYLVLITSNDIKDLNAYKVIEYKSKLLKTYFDNTFIKNNILEKYKIFLALDEVCKNNNIRFEDFANDETFVISDNTNFIELKI